MGSSRSGRLDEVAFSAPVQSLGVGDRPSVAILVNGRRSSPGSTRVCRPGW